MEFSTKRAERLSQACNKNTITGKEYGVPFPTEKIVQYPVYIVPAEILSYNFGNGRIAAEKGSLEHRRDKKFNPNISSDQKAIAEILLTSVWYGKKATQYLMESLSTVGQTDAAIVTFDGVLINGNRRTACLNSLFESSGKPQYKKVDVVVLPKNISDKEKLDLENRLQLASDYRQEYGGINDRIRLRSLKQNKFTMKEIIHSVKGRWKESDIETKIEEINLIGELKDGTLLPESSSCINLKISSGVTG